MIRVGSGHDSHRLVTGRPLILGGVLGLAAFFAGSVPDGAGLGGPYVARLPLSGTITDNREIVVLSCTTGS